MSPYYFEKVGVILRVESNPGWRLIKATAAPTLALCEMRRNRERQLQMSICCTGCIAFFIRFDTDKISFYDMYLSQSLLRVWRTEVNWKCSLCLKLPRDQSSCVKLEKFKKSNIRSNSWQWDGDFSWSVHLSVQGFGPENNILTTTGQISMRGGINNHVYREQFLIILLTPWPSVYCRHQVKISHWLKCSGSQQDYL